MGRATGYEDEIVALLSEVPLIHERMVRAGLLRTGHKMHEVVREIGWEVADLRSANRAAIRDQLAPPAPDTQGECGTCGKPLPLNVDTPYDPHEYEVVTEPCPDCQQEECETCGGRGGMYIDPLPPTRMTQWVPCPNPDCTSTKETSDNE